MIFTGNEKVGAFTCAAVMALSMLITGCGGKQVPQAGAMQVKAMQVIQQDVPLNFDFAGQIVSKDEVKVQSKVSGNVVEKYVTGGQYVTAGQPLYRIDSRQYESAVLSARANLAQAEATLQNAQVDLARNQQLLAAEAISEQAVTTQASRVHTYEAAAAASAALVSKAQQDLDDTIIYAPMSGQLSVNDVAVGTFAVAGNTTLVTIGSASPVYAQFSVSETEYLKFVGAQSMQSGGSSSVSVQLTLSNGDVYPILGKVVQTDRALSNNTGTLTVKALFENPNGLLLPGMFARVHLTGEIVPNAILVPQRAVQQLLDKSFVMVIGENGKSEARTVKLGDKIGSYYIVTDGIMAGDKVVVEGLTNLREGVDLSVTDVTPEEMGFSLDEDMSAFRADKKPSGL